MTLTRLARNIDRFFWRWRKPPPDPVVINLQCRRVALSTQHKPRRHIDKQLRDHKHAQLRQELGR